MKWEYKRFSLYIISIHKKNHPHILPKFVWVSLRPEHQDQESKLPEKFYSEEEVSAWYYVDETELLNLYGLENWELVSVVTYGPTSKEFFLKRALAE